MKTAARRRRWAGSGATRLLGRTGLLLILFGGQAAISGPQFEIAHAQRLSVFVDPLHWALFPPRP